MSQAQALQLLREGIAAARAGDKGRTRLLLRQATELDAGNEIAWLWLAGVSETPLDALRCLERVLAINPQNERAQEGIRPARLQAGVAAVKDGDKTLARQLLREVTADDGGNETAWLCLAGVAESPREGLEYLQRVLEINPANAKARQGVTNFRGQLAASAPSDWQCPLCQAGADKPEARCLVCGAVLTLANLDAFGNNHSLDQAKIRAAVWRYQAALKNQADDAFVKEPDGGPSSGSQAARKAQADYAGHYHLGLALLNLKQPAEALKHLQAALGLRSTERALRAAVTALTRREAAAVAAARQMAEEEQVSPRLILVVDASPTVRKLVSMTMEKQGHCVTVAADGHEAIDQIRQKGVPDLILLDAAMPGMDGYQLCKLLRQNPDTSQVPIIMLSGKDGFFNKMRGRMAGSTECITKPFQPDGLVEVLTKYCRARPAAALPGSRGG